MDTPATAATVQAIKPMKKDLLLLGPKEAAAEFKLSEEDAVILVGSGVRVEREWLEEFRSRIGRTDFTIRDCAILTGTPEGTFHRWRHEGLLKVGVRAAGPRGILVPPIELVRVLRAIAVLKNGMTQLPETATEFNKRVENDRQDFLAACEGN